MAKIDTMLREEWLKKHGVAGDEPIPSSNHLRRGRGGSLPDHPECDKITVVTSRCFTGVIT